MCDSQKPAESSAGSAGALRLTTPLCVRRRTRTKKPINEFPRNCDGDQTKDPAKHGVVELCLCALKILKMASCTQVHP